MTGRLDGKTAVITGGASGMGRDSVFAFCREGANVVVADFNEETGKQTVADLGDAGFGDRVRFLRVDVADESDIEAMVAHAVDEFGGLDIMFNNAGIGGAVGPITHLDIDDWRTTFAVLVDGVFLGTKHAARVMKASGRGGSIINTSSVAGISGGKGPQAYTAAKHAVVGITRATSLELAEDHIRVNAICPGGINTPLINFGAEDEAGKMLDSIQAWPEHGRGDDIANAALYLGSDESRFVTGHTLVVDGGLTVGNAGGLTGRRRPEFENMVGMTYGSTGREMAFKPIED